MEDLIIFVIFIIISLVSFFRKKNERGQTGSQEVEEQQLAETQWMGNDNTATVPHAKIITEKIETRVQEKVVRAPKQHLRKHVRKTVTDHLLHHDDTTLGSSLLKSVTEHTVPHDRSVENDDSPYKRKQARKRTVVDDLNLTSSKSLRNAFIVKEILDRPRAFDI